MKKIMLLCVVFATSFMAQAQIQTPQSSPFSRVEQKVGLTDVTVEYSRPSMRNRTIFGGLVPYGEIWRTGANENTKITFSTDVTVNGQELKAGTYAIYTKPNKEKWNVMFYSDATNWGHPEKWDESKVAAKATVDVYPLPEKIETFTITFDDLTSNSAVLGMLWENTYVGVEFQVPTDKMVTDAITKTMKGPDANDYYSAAVYYFQEGKDIKQAKEWIDKAISMSEKPAFWQLRQQSLIYAKAGDKKGAIEAAKKSLAAAEAAKNNDYIKMNKASLKEWGAL